MRCRPLPRFAGLLAVLAALCPASAEDNLTELLADPRFERGFIVLRPEAGAAIEMDRLRGPVNDGEPAWRLAQWHSRFPDLGEPAPHNGGLVYENAGKTVRLHGGDDEILMLRVNGHAEYDGAPRGQGDPWAHLLVEQDIESRPSLAELDALHLSVRYRLLESVLHRPEDYSEHIHAAQFLLFLLVRDGNPESEGYGDFLWFGVPLYDNRHEYAPRRGAPDVAAEDIPGGTGRFIFTPGTREYTDESAHGGGWVHIERDLIPLIDEGLESAWEHGFLDNSRERGDFRIMSINMGWEMPGLFDAAAAVSELSLRADYGGNETP